MTKTTIKQMVMEAVKTGEAFDDTVDVAFNSGQLEATLYSVITCGKKNPVAALLAISYEGENNMGYVYVADNLLGEFYVDDKKIKFTYDHDDDKEIVVCKAPPEKKTVSAIELLTDIKEGLSKDFPKIEVEYK